MLNRHRNRTTIPCAKVRNGGRYNVTQSSVVHRQPRVCRHRPKVPSFICPLPNDSKTINFNSFISMSIFVIVSARYGIFLKGKSLKQSDCETEKVFLNCYVQCRSSSMIT